MAAFARDTESGSAAKPEADFPLATLPVHREGRVLCVER
jgi:hypothetical protein